MASTTTRLSIRDVRNPGCTDCKMHSQAGDEKYICVTARGYLQGSIAVVTKFPAMGGIKKEIEKYLSEAGINTSKVVWMSAIKCSVFGGDPSKSDLKACRPYFTKELEALPNITHVLALGNEALYASTGKSGIMKYRGKIDLSPNDRVLVFPTISPAMVARSPGYKEGLIADLRYFKNLSEGKHVDNPDHKPGPDRTTIVDTKDRLRALLSELERATVVSYDIETTGATEFAEDAAVVSLSMTVMSSVQSPKVKTSKSPLTDGKAHVWEVPLYHPESVWRNNWVKVLTLITKRLQHAPERVAQNGKYDSRWLLRFTDILVTLTWDTIMSASVLNENAPKGLKPRAQQLLGADPWGISTKDLLSTPLDEVLEYNGEDTWHTLRLKFHDEHELKQFPKLAKFFHIVPMAGINTLIEPESRGVYVSPELFEHNWAIVRKTLEDIESKLEEHLPDPDDPAIPDKFFNRQGELQVNYNASHFSRWWLFDYLELPVLARGKKKDDGRPGDPSVAEGVMMELAEKHEAAKLLLERVKWNKFDSAFFASYNTQFDENHRLHTVFKPWGTVTGRLSSGKEDEEKVTGSKQTRGLNLQQVPRDKIVRGLFGAEDGWYIAEADYSQVELRVAAFIAREENMLRLYATGQDIHMAMAMRMTNKPKDQVTSEERKKAKAVNFGFLYGMGWRKFIETAWNNYGVRVTEEESIAFRRAFFDEFPALSHWHNRQRRLAHKYKRVETPMGRIRHLPSIDSANQDQRAEAERQSINSPVQAFASDMTQLSMSYISKAFKRKGIEAYVIGTVHDAVLFEMKQEAAPRALPIIKHVMENLPLERLFGIHLDVPIVADLKLGKRWGGAHEIPGEFLLKDHQSELRQWIKEEAPV